jgi:uncharacterized protein
MTYVGGMTTVMTRSAREQFLSDLHVGVLSVVRDDAGGTLTVPIWYSYAPGEGVSVITSPASHKGRALAATGRFSLVAQDESPYRYVSVEGPVTEVRPVDYERDLVPMSIRYLGDDLGKRYAQQWAEATAGSDRVYTMRPERWASADLSTFFDDI